jgi:gas vesicle protein
MAMNDKIKKAGTAAGAATAAAPYVRRLMSDHELRSAVQDLGGLAERLYEELSDGENRLQDSSMAETLKQQAGRVVDSVQHTARRMTGAERREEKRREEQRRRNRLTVLFGAGVGLLAAGLAAALLLYPRSRKSLARVAEQTRERAASTAREASGKVTATASKLRDAD